MHDGGVCISAAVCSFHAAAELKKFSCDGEVCVCVCVRASRGGNWKRRVYVWGLWVGNRRWRIGSSIRILNIIIGAEGVPVSILVFLKKGTCSLAAVCFICRVLIYTYVFARDFCRAVVRKQCCAREFGVPINC